MYIHVKVIAGVKKESFVQLKDDHFAVSVKEPAVRNLANRRVLEILAGHFKLPVSKIRITSGHRSSSKIFRIERG